MKLPMPFLGMMCAVSLTGGGCHTHQGAARLDDDGRTTGYVIQRPTPYGSDVEVFDLATLGSVPDPQVFAGRPIRASNARVRRVLDSQNILVESGEGRWLCVHSQLPLRGVRAGDFVNFAGTVKNMSDTARTVVGLGDKAASAVEDAAVFIDAQTVEISP